LKTRAEFLRVRGGSRCATPAFVLEARPRVGGVGDPGPRYGFTITKKIGNAVTRNRIRRRLKAALAAMTGPPPPAPHDYVLVARRAAFDIPFATLQKDLERAMQRVHHAAGTRPGRNAGGAT
jgi:ribonuclease P protein component